MISYNLPPRWVLDAFGSDNVPAHLLTREAIELYFRKLAPGGALLVNVSNIYVNLRPIFANEAAALGYVCYGRIDTKVTDAEIAAGKVESSWVGRIERPATVAGPRIRDYITMIRRERG